MIGIFDSGMGGFITLSELRRLKPGENICFLRDRKNSPYGTKREEELLEIINANVARLRAAGADKILMACCTASTLYDRLAEREKSICTPIIRPTAKAASLATKSGRIGVLATRRTVESGAFKAALFDIDPTLIVTEIEAQSLVATVEAGGSDESATAAQKSDIYRLTAPLREKGIDTLILGCTHFPAFKHSIGECLSGVNIISAAKIGAQEISRKTNSAGKARLI